MVRALCSHRSPRGDRRCLKEDYFPLFVLFVLFGQAKRTLKEKNYNVTFPLSYFCVTKSTKSHQRERSPLFANSSRVHELVARAERGKCMRQMVKRKSIVSRSPQSHTTTRANISHEKAEQIRARIACTPAYIGVAGVGLICALTKARIFASLLQWEKVARFTATDEVLHVYCAKQILSHNVRTHTFAKSSTARFAIA